MGDFLTCLILIGTYSQPHHSSLTLCNTVFDCNLYQIIDEPTHIHGNTLDLVLTTTPESISNIHINKHSQTILSLRFFSLYVIVPTFLTQLAPSHILITIPKLTWLDCLTTCWMLISLPAITQLILRSFGLRLRRYCYKPLMTNLSQK